jgi:DNA-binding CsgD family transcriptional regulator
VASAGHRFTSGEVSRAREILEEVIPDLSGGPLRARARLQLAIIRSDEPRVGFDLLRAGLDDAGEDDRWSAQLELELTAAASDIGELTTARAHAESAVRTAERLGDHDLLARALGELLVTLVITGEPLRHDVLTRLSAMPDSIATTTYHQPATAIASALHWAGFSEQARPGLERAAQRALSRGEEWDRLGVLLTLAQLEWEMGNHAVADQHRHAAEEALGEFAEGFIWLLGLDARCALEKGDLTGARTMVEKGLLLAEQTAAFWQTVRLGPVLAAVELLSGQPDVAHTRLAELRESLESNGFGPAGYGRTVVWSLDLEALIALDRLDEAEDVLAELRSRVQVCASDCVFAVAARCEGLLLAANGDLVAALEAMDGALAAHLRRPRPFEHGRTLLEKGSIERRARHKAAAKQTLEHALAILEPLGAEIWVTRARDELSRIGLRRPRATEGLTPAETRVAELVVAGATNAAIARELHMSQRTVESHLTRIYREHGVTSRSQLTAALASRTNSR